MIGSILKFPFFLLLFSSGRRFLGTAIVTILLLVVFWHWGPQRVDLSAREQRALQHLVKKAVEQFPNRAEMKIAGFVKMVSDREQWAPLVTDAIRERVMNAADGKRKFDILAPGFFERIARSLGFSTVMREKTTDEMQAMAKRLGRDTDAILLVRFGGPGCYVEDADGNATGRLVCEFYFKDGRAPHKVVAKYENTEPVTAVEVAETAVHTMPVARRCLWALGIVLLFPFVMAPLTVRIIRSHSTTANFLMVGVYTAVNILVVLALTGAPEGWTQSLLMAIAMIAILFYTLSVCELIAGPERKRRRFESLVV